MTCAANTGLAGFGMPDQQGNYLGLDADTCRAVAAAVLGDAKKVKFIPTTTQQRFTVLQSGEADILTRNTTWTALRDTEQGFNFVARHLLRRAGLHGREEGRHQERQGTRRRHRLRPAGHHHRAQSRRLFPHQSHDLQAAGRREAGRGRERLLLRPLRRLHDRPLRPRRDARRQGVEPRRLRHPARDHLQGAAGAGGAARRRRVVRHRQMDDLSP